MSGKFFFFFGEVIVRDSQELAFFLCNAMNCALIDPESVKGIVQSRGVGRCATALLPVRGGRE